MILHDKLRCILILLIFAVACPLIEASAADNSFIEKYTLSAPDIKLEELERIVEIKLTILHGFIVSVPRIPPGWYLHIDLPAQWETDLSAGSIIGVAGLTNKEVNFFNDFLVIERTGDQEPPLSIDLDIITETLTKTRDAVNKKKHSFSLKNLTLHKLK
jgi:hypothetical protein